MGPLQNGRNSADWLQWMIATAIGSLMVLSGLGIWGHSIFSAQERRVQEQIRMVQQRITGIESRQESYQDRMETKFSAMHQKVNEIYKILIQNPHLRRR